MKNLIWLLLILVFICALPDRLTAQNDIEISYDASGNRTGMNVVELKMADASGDTTIIEPVQKPNPENEHLAFADGDGFRVYPNPTTGTLFIEAATGTEMTDGKVVVYNNGGMIVERLESVSGHFTIDLSPQPAGVYFMNIYYAPDQVTHWKIIKQ